jgi:predicted DNA-binding transcriptional regulator AlpA
MGVKEAQVIQHAMIPIREVCRRVGLGRAAIRARMNPTSSRFDPTFPLPIRRGRFVGWVEAEVVAYLAGREKVE